MLVSGGRPRGCTCRAWLHAPIPKHSCRPGVAALRALINSQIPQPWDPGVPNVPTISLHPNPASRERARCTDATGPRSLTELLMPPNALIPLRVRVTASYGRIRPSLRDLSGPPPPGYARVAALVKTPRALPSSWFIQPDDEFSPPLLILGTFYEVEATTELDARAKAAARFAKELNKHRLPLPAGSNPREASRLGLTRSCGSGGPGHSRPEAGARARRLSPLRQWAPSFNRCLRRLTRGSRAMPAAMRRADPASP